MVLLWKGFGLGLLATLWVGFLSGVLAALVLMIGVAMRILPVELQHDIGKDEMQGLEHTNGIVWQQTGWWQYLRQTMPTTAE